MSLLHIADQNPTVASFESTVTQAIHNMLDNHVGAVCVVDNEGRVAGICTERDIMRRFALSGKDPNTTPIREIMTTPVELATEQMTEAEALSVMLERHYRHLPIVDGDARLLGILSIRHVLEARIDELVQELDDIKAKR